MPIYHFDVYDGLDLPDTVGTDLTNLATAKVEAIRLAGDLISNSAQRMVDIRDWRLEVTDPLGLVLFTIHFTVSDAPVTHGVMVAVERPD